MTSLFILFALIFHIQAISNAPEVFPQTNPGQELQDSSGKKIIIFIVLKYLIFIFLCIYIFIYC